MEFTTADLKTFQSLYRKHFNIELDRDTAYRKLSLLVRQMEIVYQPITKTQVAALKNLDVNRAEDEQTEANLQQQL